MAAQLTIYKASAGSGKTFRLAVHYITMLIKQPECYRHILAVTFTNKATAEMKQRILSQLYGIGHNLKSSKSYYDEVKRAVTYNEQTIRHNAIMALDFILQDYGHFRVETIDSFFQSVLRNMARELHIGANLYLELDTDVVISDAVDTFLASLKEHTQEQSNVKDFVENNIDNDKSWSIDGTLKGFSKELFSEIFMAKGAKLRDILSHPKAISDYRHNLIKARDAVLPELQEQVMSIGIELFNALDMVSLDIDCLARHVDTLFIKSADGTILDKPLGKTIFNCIAEPLKKLFSKTIRDNNPQATEAAAEQIAPLLEQIAKLHERHTYLANSYMAALEYTYSLGLLLNIRHQIDIQNEEQERFILADTPFLLSELKEGDTSFVFEKTGSFIRHLMIDEFQDTSHLQWSNLYLLLLECLSSGRECLVVGDVKQSIYRWRNSDWNILNEELEERFNKYEPTVMDMTVNYRSERKVIEFNNELFSAAIPILNDIYVENTGHDHNALTLAYSSVAQEPSSHRDGGYVYAELIKPKNRLDKEAVNEIVYAKIDQQIDRLLQAGVDYNDIAILCRNKRDIAQIAGWFSGNKPQHKMVSSEAFSIDAAISVRIIINTMRWLTDRNDKIALTQLIWEWHHYVELSNEPFENFLIHGIESHIPNALLQNADTLTDMSLYELTESIYALLNLHKAKNEDQYILAFMDLVNQWLTHNSNELPTFLSDWDERLHNTPIPTTQIDGIRLLTIHKSKGLEFHTVIVPFCSWPLYESNHENRIWVEPANPPFNEVPLLPIRFCSTLATSEFKENYSHELGQQFVDNMNLLYVALTRARCNLIIISPPTNKGKSIHNIIDEALPKRLNYSIEEDGDIGYEVYENGTICPHINQKVELSNNPFDVTNEQTPLVMNSYPIGVTFRQSGETARFVRTNSDDESYTMETALQDKYIENGKLLHAVFATIKSQADVDSYVEQLLKQGVISTVQKASQIKGLIHKRISEPQVKHWFDGTYNSLNEVSIVFRDGGVLQTRRPDRVMTTESGDAIVVDFKFGREREEYLHQVHEYMELLIKMGYSNVTGYIWYVYSDKKIKVAL